MTDETNSENGLPPKLDLRKKGIVAPGGTPEPLPSASPLTSALPPSSGDPESLARTDAHQYASGTIRIKIPAADSKNETVAPDGPEPLTLRSAAAVSAVPSAKPSSYAPAAVKPVAAPSATVAAKLAAAVPTAVAAKPSSSVYPSEAKLSGAPISPVATPKEDVDENENKDTAVPVDLNQTAPAAAPAVGPGPRPVMRPFSGPKTIKLKKPVPMGIKRETADLNTEPGVKSSTSKISLPANVGGPSDPVPAGTKTIRIAPSQTGQIPVVGKTGDQQGTAQTPDPKRQTSRISLESVMGGGDTSSSAAPKTIKLKRPEPAGPTVRMKGPDASVNTPDTLESEAETAEGDVTDEEKKTIKVKRPSVRMSVRSSTSAGSQGDEVTDAPTMFAPPVSVNGGEDRAHWTFILAAFAAMLVSFVLIYVLLAQVIGPNISLTELSYGSRETVLDWPGRIK